MFRQASLQLARAHFPEFQGPVFLHELQAHIVGRIVEPIFDSNIGRGDVALDLGCGSGTTAMGLARRGAIAFGIDLDANGFQKYPEAKVIEPPLVNLPAEPGAYLIAGDISRLPLPDGSVDLITSRWVFEHLENPQTVVAEIRRVLRPGGVVVLIVPNLRHPGIFLSSILPLRIKQALLRSSSGIEEERVMRTYYRANTPRALDRLFDDGFETVDLVNVQDPSYWLFSKTLFKTAARLGRITRTLPLDSFHMHTVATFRRTDVPTF